jgi:MinD-like ATPase involved in chromosome partitioning or flagellar assembly
VISRVVLVLPQPVALALREQLLLEGAAEVAIYPPERFAATVARGLGADAELHALIAAADTMVLAARVDQLTTHAVALADARGVRILPLGDDAAAARLAAAFGLAAPVPTAGTARDVAAALATASSASETARPVVTGPRLVAIWGPHGAPGRSTIAVGLAAELARGGRHVALVDADAHAPSLAMALGLPDEGPGFAVACRQAELDALDEVELQRISVALGGADVDVLTGINRPSRWPELSERRVRAALAACARWAEHTVVDVAASLERDEEIVSDVIAGPRRNAATLAALEAADHVVAVLAADPVSVARFLRSVGELRAVTGSTPLTVVVNRLRRGAVGIDARGQLRRTLERYADIRDVWFVPEDRRAADAAMLAARPAAEVAGRSAMVSAIRRIVGEALLPPAPIAAARRERRGVRRPRERLAASA